MGGIASSTGLGGPRRGKRQESAGEKRKETATEKKVSGGERKEDSRRKEGKRGRMESLSLENHIR